VICRPKAIRTEFRYQYIAALNVTETEKHITFTPANCEVILTTSNKSCFCRSFDYSSNVTRITIISGTTARYSHRTTQSTTVWSAGEWSAHVTWCGTETRDGSEAGPLVECSSSSTICPYHHQNHHHQQPAAAHLRASWSENITRRANGWAGAICRAINADHGYQYHAVTDIRLRVTKGLQLAAPFHGSADITHHVTSGWLVRRQRGRLDWFRAFLLKHRQRYDWPGTKLPYITDLRID